MRLTLNNLIKCGSVNEFRRRDLIEKCIRNRFQQLK